MRSSQLMPSNYDDSPVGVVTKMQIHQILNASFLSEILSDPCQKTKQ